MSDEVLLIVFECSLQQKRRTICTGAFKHCYRHCQHGGCNSAQSSEDSFVKPFFTVLIKNPKLDSSKSMNNRDSKLLFYSERTEFGPENLQHLSTTTKGVPWPCNIRVILKNLL